jgi:hypothetical protein
VCVSAATAEVLRICVLDSPELLLRAWLGSDRYRDHPC